MSQPRLAQIDALEADLRALFCVLAAG